MLDSYNSKLVRFLRILQNRFLRCNPIITRNWILAELRFPCAIFGVVFTFRRFR